MSKIFIFQIYENRSFFRVKAKKNFFLKIFLIYKIL